MKFSNKYKKELLVNYLKNIIIKNEITIEVNHKEIDILKYFSNLDIETLGDFKQLFKFFFEDNNAHRFIVADAASDKFESSVNIYAETSIAVTKKIIKITSKII